MDHSQYIIETLSAVRKARGMNIAELARRSEISPKRLSYLLLGERDLRADEFARMIIVLGLPVSDFVPRDIRACFTKNGRNSFEGSGITPAPPPKRAKGK